MQYNVKFNRKPIESISSFIKCVTNVYSISEKDATFSTNELEKVRKQDISEKKKFFQSKKKCYTWFVCK